MQQYVRIKLVEASDRVLTMFDEALQVEAIKRLTETPSKLLETGLVGKDMTEVLLKVSRCLFEKLNMRRRERGSEGRGEIERRLPCLFVKT
jgi:hypothetical protein